MALFIADLKYEKYFDNAEKDIDVYGTSQTRI